MVKRMDDLISRMSLRQSIVASLILGGEKTLDQIIDEEPSIDAVPVIRCKDCKYARMTYDGECKYCDVWFPDEAEYLDGDYYCASAERREDG